jgi:diguanylate cyclase (GGDEF)-like protein
MSSLLGNATAPPRLPGIRRMVVVGAVALTMVVLAIAASLFELRHDRDMRHQYENSLMVTHVAFDAESLASRMHTWEDLNEPAAAPVPAAASAVPGAAAPAAPPNLALREALRSVDIDLAEWQRRVTDARQRELSADTQTQLARLQDSVAAMRQALHTPSEILEAAQIGAAAGGDKPAELREGVDKAYLSAIEAAQVALLASVRSGGEKLAIGRYTESEISAAVVVGASLAALLLGAVLASMLHRAQHENRAAIGVMGELLRTDPLTGITNRRGLDENLPVEMARAKRASSPLTVAMLDLDYFKRYNSRRGHAGGDSLLRAVSQAWRKQLRPTDTLVRYGGEEFTLVLPNCGAEQAGQLIGRLRPLMPDNQTFSAGIATWDFHEDGDQLLRRADEALLTAKKQGRNRTVVSGQEEQMALVLPPMA